MFSRKDSGVHSYLRLYYIKIVTIISLLDNIISFLDFFLEHCIDYFVHLVLKSIWQEISPSMVKITFLRDCVRRWARLKTLSAETYLSPRVRRITFDLQKFKTNKKSYVECLLVFLRIIYSSRDKFVALQLIFCLIIFWRLHGPVRLPHLPNLGG